MPFFAVQHQQHIGGGDVDIGDRVRGHHDPADGRRSRRDRRQNLLAKQLGVDLALVEASGVTGIIRREDVERFAARDTVGPAAEAETPAAPTDARETRIPVRGVRKATAAAMVRSAFTAPHVTCFLEVDGTETTRLVGSLRSDPRLAEHRIGILAVVAKAVCLALRAEPSLNSRWDEEAGEIVQHNYVDLGIAAATDRGLIVPMIRDAERLTLLGMADAVRSLAEVARSGKTSPAGILIWCATSCLPLTLKTAPFP